MLENPACRTEALGRGHDCFEEHSAVPLGPLLADLVLTAATSCMLQGSGLVQGSGLSSRWGNGRSRQPISRLSSKHPGS